MKMKLAALLAATMLSLAGCGGSTNTSNATNATNTTNAANKTSSTTATPDPNVVKAQANASSEVGGTKEGCKCSAAGMSCATEPGEKGCCGAKDGACSTMVDGKSSCCSSKGSEGAACCSAAGKMAQGDKNACAPAEKPAATGTKKS